MTTSSAESWQSLITEACLLWLRLAAAYQDRQLEFSGATIHYAVDTDVVVLFAAPYEERRYANLLGLLDDDSMTAVGRCLSHHIFFGIPGVSAADARLLISPYDEEILGVYAAVRRNAAKETTGARIQIGELVDALRQAAAGKDYEEAVQLVLARRQVLDVLFGDRFTGSVNELDRMNQLFSKKRIRPIVLNGHIPAPDHEERLTIRKRSESWFDVLRGQKGRRTSALRISRDAEALAFIEWANAKLRDSGSSCRVRLVTGDETLNDLAIRASDEYERAASEFIRDPRIFLEEFPLGTENSPTSSAYSIRSWLRVFLSPLTSKGGRLDVNSVRRFVVDQRDEFRSVVIRAFQRHHGERRLNEARYEWTEFARQSSLVYGIRVKPDTEVAREVVELIWSGDMDRVRSAIDDRLVNVVGDLSATSAVAGIFLSAQRSDQFKRLLVESGSEAGRQSRLPMAVRFRDPNLREQYFRGLERALRSRNIDEIESLSGRSEVYTGHLFYALFFAAVGDWSATTQLARVANLLAERTGGLGKLPGHEAAYILAVALRHSSRTLDEFSEAIEALNEAEARWAKDGSEVGPLFETVWRLG